MSSLSLRSIAAHARALAGHGLGGLAVGLVVAVAVAFAAGCGGNTRTVTVAAPASSTSTGEESTTPTTETGSTETNPSTPSCEDTTVPICDYEGKTLHQAERDGTLHLKTLDARVVGVRAAGSVSSASFTATAKGRFLIVTLEITNHSGTPQGFNKGAGSKQAALAASEPGGETATYTPEFEAENGPDQQSFEWQSEPAQPGESQTGDVIFDVPSSIAERVASHENGHGTTALFIGNYGVDLDEDLASGSGIIHLM